MVRHYTSFIMAGALPFIAAAAATVAGIDSYGLVSSVTDAIVAYGLAIASFVAGTHWAFYLQFKASAPTNLFISSNAAVLAPWITFVVGSAGDTLVALVLIFIFLLFVDWRLHRSNLIESSYFRQRLAVTVVVCASLLLMLVA